MQWAIDPTRFVVHQRQRSVPFYVDAQDVVNPWSAIAAETILAPCFPYYVFFRRMVSRIAWDILAIFARPDDCASHPSHRCATDSQVTFTAIGSAKHNKTLAEQRESLTSLIDRTRAERRDGRPRLQPLVKPTP